MRQLSSWVFAFVFVVLFGGTLCAQDIFTEEEQKYAVTSAAIAFAPLVPSVYTGIREKESPNAIITDHTLGADDAVSFVHFRNNPKSIFVACASNRGFWDVIAQASQNPPFKELKEKVQEFNIDAKIKQYFNTLASQGIKTESIRDIIVTSHCTGSLILKALSEGYQQKNSSNKLNVRCLTFANPVPLFSPEEMQTLNLEVAGIRMDNDFWFNPFHPLGWARGQAISRSPIKDYSLAPESLISSSALSWRPWLWQFMPFQTHRLYNLYKALWNSNGTV